MSNKSIFKNYLFKKIGYTALQRLNKRQTNILLLQLVLYTILLSIT